MRSLNHNNYKFLNLNIFYSECSANIYLVMPIDSKAEGEIQLKIGDKRIISIPGSLDENLYFLTYSKQTKTYSDRLVEEDKDIQDYVSVTFFRDKEQVIDVNRFLLEHGYTFKEADSKTYSNVRRKKKRFIAHDVRKNGIFSGDRFWLDIEVDSVSADFFKGALKIEELDVTHFSGESFYDGLVEIAADYLENKEFLTKEDLLLLFKESYNYWKLETNHGDIFSRNLYEHFCEITVTCEDGEYRYRIPLDEKDVDIGTCSFLCAILKCKTLKMCKNTEMKAKMLGVI